MRKLLLPAVMGLTLLIAGSAQTQQTKSADPPKNAEEDVLQKRAEAFVKAFNDGDAKAVAAFFTTDADMVDQEGHHIEGRKAIEETYKKFFAEAKGAKLFIRIEKVRVAKPDLAFEDGLSEVVYPNGGPPTAGRYSVVYTKQEGTWYMASVREAIAVPPNNTEKLQDLGFLIGHWVEDVDKGGSAKASYAWDGHQNFILNTFDITLKGEVSIAGGVQWIGWDESAKKPRAWSFLFNGGFAEGVWNKDGDNKWKITVNGTQRDGKKVTGTNLFTKVDDDHFSFKLVDIKVDGKSVSDSPAVKMKRAK
jgi:uncharacterized protein (TIGR02246 family)